MEILAIEMPERNPLSCLATALRVLAQLGILSLLTGCASSPIAAIVAASAKPLDVYRCEYGIEFTAKFVDNSVTLDSSRGYDVLFKDSKPSSSPASPNITPVEYSNPRMNATFNLGVTGREAVLRYPLLPLVSRCVRE